jgi:hypothetical protein
MSTAIRPIADTVKPAAVKRGWPGLLCTECGQADCISLDLDDLHLHCRENDCEFSADDVPNLIAQWQRVLAWLDGAPALRAE